MISAIFSAAFGLLIVLFVGGFGFMLSSIFGAILAPLGFIIGAASKSCSRKTSTSAGYYYTPTVNPPSKPQKQPKPAQTVQTKSSSSIWNTASASGSKNWFSQTQSSKASVSNTSRTVYDLDGNPLQLGARDEKASGGEGIVYTMPKTTHIMIKLYKNSTIQNAVKMRENRKRVDAMLKIPACKNMKHLAWPLLPVADNRKEMIGFAMHACNGESFRTLGNAAAIRKKFPKWNRIQLAETALDFVMKVHKLAAAGVLVNDFNPSNFLVDRNCQVSMIDCDSYQIPGPNNTVLTTGTFFSSHVAPELLKNQKLLNSPRNIHHVEFGAAVVVFGLLMCGMHPYSFSDPGNRKKIGAPEDNLKNGYCSFAPGSKLRFPQAPNDEWYNLWTWLPKTMQDAFVATFCDGYACPNRRASLSQLESALRDTIQFMNQEKRARELMPKKSK